MKQVKVGIVGTGNMGKNHARVASDKSKIDFVGVYDVDEARAKDIASMYDTQAYVDLDEMIEKVDALIIATPTLTHYKIAKKAITAQKHCLIEKPITATVDEAKDLIALAKKMGVVLQVGHIERYNPVFKELNKILENDEILAIDSARLSYNTNRANDVDVVLDLMIHDIDAINKIVKHDIVDIKAVGHNYYTTNNDFVTAVLKSKNGVAINITASKISQTKERKLNISCRDSYVEVDYLRKEIDITRHTVSKAIEHNMKVQYKQESLVEKVFVPFVEPLAEEQKDFVESILENKTPQTTGEDGLEALQIALKIQKSCATTSL